MFKYLYEYVDRIAKLDFGGPFQSVQKQRAEIQRAIPSLVSVGHGSYANVFGIDRNPRIVFRVSYNWEEFDDHMRFAKLCLRYSKDPHLPEIYDARAHADLVFITVMKRYSKLSHRSTEQCQLAIRGQPLEGPYPWRESLLKTRGRLWSAGLNILDAGGNNILQDERGTPILVDPHVPESRGYSLWT